MRTRIEWGTDALGLATLCVHDARSSHPVSLRAMTRFGDGDCCQFSSVGVVPLFAPFVSANARASFFVGRVGTPSHNEHTVVECFSSSFVCFDRVQCVSVRHIHACMYAFRCKKKS